VERENTTLQDAWHRAFGFWHRAGLLCAAVKYNNHNSQRCFNDHSLEKI